jgi:hypothetical protein
MICSKRNHAKFKFQMLPGALTFLKYLQCFILLTVLAVCVSFPTLQPFTHNVPTFTSGQASEADLCSVHVIPPNQRGEASQRWFTLHLHTFGTDEHNAKPVTNDFTMKQEEKHRAGTVNSSTKLILTWYTSTFLYSQLLQIRCRSHFLFRISSIITKYLTACIGKLPLQYMALI